MKYVLSIVLALVVYSPVWADVMSVKRDSAEIRDSQNPYVAQVVLVVPRNYPLDVLTTADGYHQVRDFRGREGWIATEVMDPTSAVVITVNSGNIRTGPGTEHEIQLRAKQGVAFRVLAEQGEWLRVEHESGRHGWVHKNIVWGLEPRT